MSPVILNILTKNNLVGCDYIEPFAGGAGIALALLFSNVVKTIHINDIDIGIYSFWKSVLENTEQFIKKIKDTDVNISEWHRQKEILTNHQNYSLLDVGFATFFLNRTNRSGILKAGVIGGKLQSGTYKLDARFNKLDLINRIKTIGDHRNSIFVSNLDACIFLETLKDRGINNPFIYLDPPYYKKGQGLYRNYYDDKDHIEIMKAIHRIKIPWIVSYDNCEEIIKIYAAYTPFPYKLNYSAQIKKKGDEIMFFNRQLMPTII